jgi:hypothetical protein
MKIQNTPGSYGLLAGLLVLLLAVLANACAAMPKMPDEPSRTPAQMNASAVRIYTECGMGSGVLLDSVTVLTAQHVVDCDGLDAQVVIVTPANGAPSSLATIKVADRDRDLARLMLQTPVEGVSEVRVRNPKVGERLCAATVVPERAFQCGSVKEYDGPREYGDVVMRDMNVWYGNSGSGVYAADGTLVGIAVRLEWCSPGDAFLVMLTGERVKTCGGRVSSLLDSTVLG